MQLLLFSVCLCVANAALEVLVPCASPPCLSFGFTYQTGIQQTEGTALKRGYQMWANKTNAAGGISTKQGPFMVSLLAYDDQSNTTLTTQGYTDLIKVDMVNYTLGPFGSSYTNASVTVTQSLDKILVFSQAADDSLFANPHNPTDTFGIMSPASDYMHQPLEEIAILNYRTLVVIWSTAGFTTSVWNGLLGLIKSYPQLVIAANISYTQGPPSDAKFRAIVQNLTKAVPKPDVFISLSFLADGPYVTSALRYWDYQPKAICLTSLNYTDGNSLYAFGPEQWNVHQNISDPFYGTAEKFNTDYLAMFPNTGETEVSLYTAGAAASGYVLASAITAAASLAQADVRNALLNLTDPNGGNFSTIFGPVKFSAFGQNGAKEMVLTQCVYTDNTLGGELVLPGKFIIPVIYGCNNSKACNYVSGAIQNGTNCVYPTAGHSIINCNGASSISSSLSAILFLLFLAFSLK